MRLFITGWSFTFAENPSPSAALSVPGWAEGIAVKAFAFAAWLTRLADKSRRVLGLRWRVDFQVQHFAEL